MAEAQPRLEMQPALIGPAMELCLVQARDKVTGDRSRALEIHDANNAAHTGPVFS